MSSDETYPDGHIQNHNRYNFRNYFDPVKTYKVLNRPHKIQQFNSLNVSNKRKDIYTPVKADEDYLLNMDKIDNKKRKAAEKGGLTLKKILTNLERVGANNPNLKLPKV